MPASSIRPLNADGKEGKLLIFFPLNTLLAAACHSSVGVPSVIRKTTDDNRKYHWHDIHVSAPQPIQGFGNGRAHWCIALGKQDGGKKLAALVKGCSTCTGPNVKCRVPLFLRPANRQAAHRERNQSGVKFINGSTVHRTRNIHSKMQGQRGSGLLAKSLVANGFVRS